MAQFRATVCRKVASYIDVMIEAETQEEAFALAEKSLDEGAYSDMLYEEEQCTDHVTEYVSQVIRDPSTAA